MKTAFAESCRSTKNTVIRAKAVMSSLEDRPDPARVKALAVLLQFRREFYDSLTRRADALFELTDALLCADGPVTSPAELSLELVHRRGHGAMYDALAQGRLDVARLSVTLAGLALPRGADRQLTIAIDTTPWPRPDAECSPERLHYHRPCRCDGTGSARPSPAGPTRSPSRSKVAARRGPGRWMWSGSAPRTIPPP
jgi:DDE superfamily endonuclease